MIGDLSQHDPAVREGRRMVRDLVVMLDEQRQDQGLTREEWARRSRVSERVISYGMRGDHDLRAETLVRLARGVGWCIRVNAGPPTRRNGFGVGA